MLFPTRNQIIIDTHHMNMTCFVGTDVHNKSIEDEANKYGDIIQIDKNDYYYYSSCKLELSNTKEKLFFSNSFLKIK